MKSIEIQNKIALKNAWNKAPKEIERGIQIGLKKVVFTLQNKSVRNAPVGKVRGGSLRQSIRSYFPSKMKGVVTAGVKYAIFVHEGTKPHVIKVKSKKVLANRRTGQIFGKIVHHPGTKANPFFKKAVDQTNYSKIFNVHIEKAIKRTLS